MSLSTPERFWPERLREAQSRGEWPGARRTFLRGLGVEVAVVMGVEREEDEAVDVGLRFGSGPVVGTRRPAAVFGFEEGVGRREGTGREGGAMRPFDGRAGGAMRPFAFEEGGVSVGSLGGAMPPARCAEFMAGNEGGGRLSSSSELSSSSSLLSSCSCSVKDGTGGSAPLAAGVALGVVSPPLSECEDLGLSVSDFTSTAIPSPVPFL